MMHSSITEADVEHVALDWLAALGWRMAHAQHVAAGGTTAATGFGGEIGIRDWT